jgi:glyoxylase-like metal-dependent hydrolase (beta-lactamase superfamily II)
MKPWIVIEHTPQQPVAAQGTAGGRMFGPGEPPYWEIRWVDPEGTGTSSYELTPSKRLDRHVVRLLAPNPGLMTGPGTNTYLVGEQEVAIIDPGPADPRHLAAIHKAGDGRIRFIICTHTHPDHCSAAAALAQATGASLIGRSAPETEHDVGLAFDRIVEDGETVEVDGLSLRAVRTPGHASNHVCFLLERTGMLFSGDHIVQGSTVVISPPDGNMHAYLASLRRLASLNASVLAPGHGYLLGHPQAEAERLIQHRLGREDKVREALRAAGGSARLETLLPLVYNDVPDVLHPIAVHSLKAHLDKLVEDGEVSSAEDRYLIGRPA